MKRSPTKPLLAWLFVIGVVTNTYAGIDAKRMWREAARKANAEIRRITAVLREIGAIP